MEGTVEIGSRVGGYRIERMLGETPAGVVYRALDRTGRGVRLELLSPELARSTGFGDRLRRAVAQAASLGHPHIATVHEIGETDESTYVVSEDRDGTDLAALLERVGSASYLRAAGLIAQAAQALDAAHAAGLVHGAVEPARIVVAEENGADYVLVTGFGLGGSAGAGFAAPEQVEGQAPSPAADVYGLASTLHAAVTGSPPDPGSSLASETMVELPPAFNGVMRVALAEDPENRYRSPGDLVSAALRAGGLEPPPAPANRDRARVLDAWQRSLAGGARGWSPSAAARAAEPMKRAQQPPATAPVSATPAQEAPAAPPPPAAPAPAPAPAEAAAPAPDAPAAAPPEAAAPAPASPEAAAPEAAAPAAAAPEPASAAPKGPSREPVITVPDHEPRWRGRLKGRWVRPLAAGLAVLAAIVTAVVLLGADGDGGADRAGPAGSAPAEQGEPPADADAVAPAGEPTPAGEPAPDTARLIAWPDRSAYTVIVYAADSGRAEARAVARRALRAGYEAGVLDSSDHPGLEPGKVVAFAGVFRTELQARRAAGRLRAEGVTASPYALRVAPSR